MTEQTDWHERGCSRACRTGHTLVWGWCDLAEEPKPELNLHTFQTFTASDGNTSMRYRQLKTEEARAELAKFEPEPTWRDVIRAMRAEGIRLRPLYDIAESPADRTWRVLSPNKTELGCVTHRTGYWGEEWSIAFTYECGPSTQMGAEALRPADVLALARISGLIGGAA